MLRLYAVERGSRKRVIGSIHEWWGEALSLRIGASCVEQYREKGSMAHMQYIHIDCNNESEEKKEN